MVACHEDLVREAAGFPLLSVPEHRDLEEQSRQVCALSLPAII